MDIHPPLPKLLMAGLIWLSDYQKLDESNVKWWTDKGFVGTQDYLNLYNQDAYYYLRFGSLIMGTILVLTTYLLMRSLGCRKATSAFTTWMVMTDHLISVDSRLILTDVYLWTFHMMTIAASITATRAKGKQATIFWYLTTGFCLGCAVSSKYTAFGTIGFVGVHQMVFIICQLVRTCKINLKKVGKRPSFESILSYYVQTAVYRAVMILGVMAFVFCAVWMIHLQVLPYSGQGNGFMDNRFSSSLTPYFSEKEKAQAALGGCPNHANAWKDCGFPTINKTQCQALDCCWDPTSKDKWCYHKSQQPVPPPVKLPFFESLGYMLHATWSNNQGESLNYHPQMSRWWQWPLLTCKFVDFGFGIYSMGNPAVWWLVALMIVVISTYLIASTPARLFSLLIPAPPKKAVKKPKGVPVVVVEKVETAQPEEDITDYAGSIPGWLLLVVFLTGYLGNLLPFYRIVRSTWNYHYMLALLIGMILTGFSFDYAMKLADRAGKKKYTYLLLATLFVLASLQLVAFWYWSPWIYGFNISPEQKLSLRWYHLWGI